MADKLFLSVLSGEIALKDLFDWMLEAKHLNDIKENVTQGDFVLYFLNYIHEECIISKTKTSTPAKLNTPKRLKSSQLSLSVSNSSTCKNEKKTVRRTELFPVLGTPDRSVLNASVEVKDVYMSPVSPLYNKNNSFSTPKTSKNINSPHNISLADFMVNKKKTSPKKEKVKRKRINPTTVQESKHNDEVKRNSFSFKDNCQELKVEEASDHRIALCEERLRIASRKDSAPVIQPIFLSRSEKQIFVEPKPSSVCFKNELKILANVYIKLLDNNLVLNKTSELYFIVSLLATKLEPCDELMQYSREEMLQSLHNCVYFACKVLRNQLQLISILDKATLNLLQQNSALKRFDSDLVVFLRKIYDRKSKEKCVEIDATFRENVCFISDTDNRENFPNDPSFHAFRKQRDLFYEIIRIWEQNHMLSGWKFSVALGGKIRTLLNLHNDPANFMHLSRLFKSQLLSTCGTKRNQNDVVSENQLSFLSNIPNIDAQKLSKLKDRLVTKNISNGITPLPTFPGNEEFYKEFLFIASNPCFIKHLTDIFVHEILELNETNFVGTDLDESGSDVDPATKKSFAICLKSLRILAKFVGFIESLPYNSESLNSSSSEHLLSTQIRIRYQTVPPINVKQLVLDAIRYRKLTMTVPWVCNFIAMLDFASLRLPYYQEVYDILFEIYYKDQKVDRNVTIVKLSLGWLFELPNFPEGLYVSWITNKMGQCLSQRLIHSHSSILCANAASSFQSIASTSTPKASSSLSVNNISSINLSNNSNKEIEGIDDLDILDDGIMYMCCPYLTEIKQLLCNDSEVSKRGSIKHITPVSSVQSTTNMQKKQLEMQLEEAFFNGQQISMRKTVEFVSERVASSCVKHICNELVPNAKKEAMENVRKLIREEITIEKENQQDDVDYSERKEEPFADDFKKRLTQKVEEYARNACLPKLKEVCDSEVRTMCLSRIRPSIIALLANDVLKATSDTCIAIATRMCLERVEQWTMSHVNFGVFTKDFYSELKKAFNAKDESMMLKFMDYKPPILLPAGGKDIKHNPDATTPVKMMQAYKETTILLLEEAQVFDESIIINIIEKTIQTREERCDLNQLSWFTICKMFIELVLLCISYRPDFLGIESQLYNTIMHFVNTYAVTEKEELFKKILCPRNVMIMSQSRNLHKTWDVYTRFLTNLLERDIVSCHSFEKQCVSLYQETWHETLQQRIGTCFQDIVDSLKRNGKLTPGFDFLLTWLADYCNDMDM